MRFILLVLAVGATSCSEIWKLQPPITNVTDDGSLFNGNVYVILEHPDIPDEFIVTDIFSIWSFNPYTKNKTLIAGSKQRGYQRGRGAEAKFSHIHQLVVMKPTEENGLTESVLLVADMSNHCIRTVSLKTTLTAPLAGMCGIHGFIDGPLLEAKFYGPIGIVQASPDGFVISELYNDAIRKFGLSSSVITLAKLDFHPAAFAVDSRETSNFTDELHFTFQHGLAKLTLSTSNVTIVAGSVKVAGSRDGAIDDSTYWEPEGSVVLEDGVMLLADYWNRALRLVELVNGTVRTVELNVPGRLKPLYPFTVFRRSNTVYAGLTGGIIVSFPADKIIVPVDFCSPIKIYLPYGEDKIKRVEYGKVLYLTPGETIFERHHPRGISCNQSVIVFGEPKLICPENFTLTVDSEARILYTLPKIEKDDRLRCVFCPLREFLTRGENNIIHTYRDDFTQITYTCAYTIFVTSQKTCQNGTRTIHLKKGEAGAVVDKIPGCSSTKMNADAGRYLFEHRLPSRSLCIEQIDILPYRGVRYQAVFSITYALNCDSLNSISQIIINRDLERYFTDTQQICSDCRLVSLDANSSNVTSCENGTFLVKWRTDVNISDEEYNQNGTATLTALETAINKYVKKATDFRGRFMPLTILTKLPRTITPTRRQGKLFSLNWIKTCVDTDLKYDERLGVCDII